MKEKTNQHYVWQKYLEPWTTNGQIWCLRENKIFLTATRNIASQRYFYDLSYINPDDINLIRRILVEPASESLKPLCDTWLKQIEKVNAVVADLTAKNLCKYSDFEMIYRNVYEELHGIVESRGLDGLMLLRANKPNFLLDINTDNDIRMNFLFYLAVQYLRTKNMKANVKKNFLDNNPFSNIDSCINLMVPILATNFAYCLSNALIDKTIYYHMLINNTTIPFITGDQPVINIKANVDSTQLTESLELYYPLSPVSALLISAEKSASTSINVDEAKYYNNTMQSQAFELILANNRTSLLEYIDKG